MRAVMYVMGRGQGERRHGLQGSTRLVQVYILLLYCMRTRLELERLLDRLL